MTARPPSAFPRPRRGAIPAVVALGLLLLCATVPVTAAPAWTPTTWHEEAAYELATGHWRAIVSVERGRLVHFGPAGRPDNLLFAPATREEAVGWGGHRVWFGPQDTWSRFWPPPAAWEKSAAEHTSVAGPRLTLVLPATGDGWPRLTRVYEFSEGRLACGITFDAGGTRDVQVMQILQTPSSGVVAVPIVSRPEAPLGGLLLPPFQNRPAIVPLADVPPSYLSRAGDVWHVRHSTQLDKIAFPPQELVSHISGYKLRVGRGPSEGREVGAPDRGFYTQVCPGERSMPVIELEQMSPLYAAGEAATFTLLLDLVAE